MTLKDYCSPKSWWELWPCEQIFPLFQPLSKEKDSVAERRFAGSQEILNEAEALAVAAASHTSLPRSRTTWGTFHGAEKPCHVYS